MMKNNKIEYGDGHRRKITEDISDDIAPIPEIPFTFDSMEITFDSMLRSFDEV